MFEAFNCQSISCNLTTPVREYRFGDAVNIEGKNKEGTLEQVRSIGAGAGSGRFQDKNKPAKE